MNSHTRPHPSHSPADGSQYYFPASSPLLLSANCAPSFAHCVSKAVWLLSTQTSVVWRTDHRERRLHASIETHPVAIPSFTYYVLSCMAPLYVTVELLTKVMHRCCLQQRDGKKARNHQYIFAFVSFPFFISCLRRLTHHCRTTLDWSGLSLLVNSRLVRSGWPKREVIFHLEHDCVTSCLLFLSCLHLAWQENDRQQP